MNAIECNNLTKQFGDFKAVNGISLSVKKGEIFGFLGANGYVSSVGFLTLLRERHGWLALMSTASKSRSKSISAI